MAHGSSYFDCPFCELGPFPWGVVGVPSPARGAPTLAAAATHSAFNLANAAGAFLGGRAIHAGLGWTSPDWVGAILAASGLGLALVAGALDKKSMALSPLPS